jgi:TBCC domain-containing protein 1
MQFPVTSALESSGNILSPGADDRATVDVSMKTPILLPSSEFDVLLVPVESDEARTRRQQLKESAGEMAAVVASSRTNEKVENPISAGDATGITSERDKGERDRLPSPIESEYCRMLVDLLTLSPFNMPYDYERRVVAKAERVRTLQSAMLELNSGQRAALEEELNRGFQDWLATSGNFRQVLDLIHLDK